MVTLDRLANVLSGYGIRLRLGAVPRSVELRSVVIHGADQDPTEVGDVLLGIGARSVSEVVDWAVSARAVVALVREGAETDEPENEGVAVLVVDPAVAWSELAAVVYGLVLEGRETEAGRGPTDLFALADSLADAVGGAVTIEDRRSRVLAYSRPQQNLDPARVETILDREMPQWLRAVFDACGVFVHLASSDEPLFVPAQAELGVTGRMVVAVRVGRQLLGSVWVSCPAPLAGARRTALADGARTVALHLLRSRASADLERQVESELVIRLLEGAADAATVASRLGLPPEGLRVIALRARSADDQHAALLLLFERATTGFGWSRSSRSALVGDTIYTVLPADQAATARRWISELQAALPAPMTVSAGISGVARATESASARRETDECLALHEARSAGAPPPAYDESWDEILLQRLRTAGLAGRTPARGPIAELRQHDRTNSTRYVATLRAWLQAQGDPAQAGTQLGVHENTVRNRLRKMAEVTDLGLDDPRKRLAMMIELAVTDDA
ncbi:PucR family transcriptional regulator [Nocardia sp. NPDC057455]|uniref:PucR family transcriptional regulator n=1 Tax=Nocardia sp. NPDC057455 TaxID=3346138 RepID=UPI00366BF143